MTATAARHTLILSEDDAYAEAEAVHEGRASEVWACPVDGSIQGIASRRRMAGHPQGFDGGEVMTLRCGHTLV